MATAHALRQTASVRTNILLTPAEHKHWTAAARRRGISFGEYVRRSLAAADDAPTPEELAELRALAQALSDGAARMHAAIDAALAQLDASTARERTPSPPVAPIALDPAVLDFGA